jgi:hypothetical protein
MHILDAFHPDGISYGSGDDFSDTDSDSRSSQEKDDKDNPPIEDKLGKYLDRYLNSFEQKKIVHRPSMKKPAPIASPPINIVIVRECFYF